MLGRLAVYDDSTFRKEAKELFSKIKNKLGHITPTYNLAPTHNISALLNTMVFVNAHFGLIPSWAKDKKTININIEVKLCLRRRVLGTLLNINVV